VAVQFYGGAGFSAIPVHVTTHLDTNTSRGIPVRLLFSSGIFTFPNPNVH